MNVGDLCVVSRMNTHSPCQLGQLVLVTKNLGSVYLEAMNIKTLNFHHYSYNDLELISESG